MHGVVLMTKFVIIADPLTVDAPLLKQPLHFMPDQSAAPSWMTETLAKIKESAGFVIVSAEYNCTIPPALTNLLDHFPLDAYRHKPASIVTYTLGNTPFQLIAGMPDVLKSITNTRSLIMWLHFTLAAKKDTPICSVSYGIGVL